MQLEQTHRDAKYPVQVDIHRVDFYRTLDSCGELANSEQAAVCVDALKPPSMIFAHLDPHFLPRSVQSTARKIDREQR